VADVRVQGLFGDPFRMFLGHFLIQFCAFSIARQEGSKIKTMTVTCKFFSAQNDPPQTPILTPHTNKKGVCLRRIHTAICLHSFHAN
jgi:hypothetical protein